MIPESRYLQQLARAFVEGEDCDSDLAPAADDFLSWDKRLQLLLDHNVFGSLVPLISGRDFSDVQRTRLRESLDDFSRRNTLMLLELERILLRLEAAGCAPVVLKGAALASTVYESPGQRYFIDLDILVPRERIETACDVLLGGGYRLSHGPGEQAHYAAHHFHWILLNARGHCVEIHWALTLPDSIFDFDLDGLRERARTAPLGRGAMRVPSAQDQILHAVLQCIADGFSDLRRILDTALLLRRIDDPAALIDQARAQNMSCGLWILLKLTRDLTGVGIPGEALDRIAPGAGKRRVLEKMNLAEICLQRQAIETPWMIFLLHALSVPTPRLLMRELYRHVFPEEGALLEMGFAADRMPGWWRRKVVSFGRLRSLARIALYLLSR